MRTRPVLPLTALVLLLAACGPTGPAVESPDDPDLPTPGAQASERRVCREPLGPDEENPIGQADGEHPAFAGTSWWGPVAEAVDRGAVPGTAGVWLDQQAGELVVMVTADDPAAVLEDLRARVEAEHAERVVCMQATHELDALMQLQQQAHQALTDADVIASSSLDTVGNRVEVAHEGDPAQVADALGELADQPALHVTRPACADVVDLPADAVALPGDGSTCGGMHALLTGTLAGDPAAGCLWIESGNERTSIAWPRGWYVMPDGTVHDHRGEPRATVGDEVHAGGGHVGGEGAQAADPCGPSGGDFLLNALDPASVDEAG